MQHTSNIKSLSLLLKDLDAQCLNENYLTPQTFNPHTTPIKEITLDIKEVQAGVLFIARSMWYLNTHTHIEQAIQQQATAIIVSEPPKLDLTQIQVPIYYIKDEDPTLGVISSRFYNHPTHDMKVYGVTGTNGKTSTVNFLKELLQAAGEKVATMGTVGYCFNHECVPAPNTTPDALVIQRFAYDVLQAGATALVLEVSSHGLALQRVAGITFDVVGFTTLGRDHLDFHHSFEEYRQCKSLLFSNCLQESLAIGKQVTAVAHNHPDSEYMLTVCPQSTHKIICQTKTQSDTVTWQTIDDLQSTYGDTPSYQQLLLSNIHPPTLQGLHLQITQDNQDAQYTFHTPLIGDYHQENLAIALAMYTVHHAHQIPQACEAMQSTVGVPGRMQLVSSHVDRRVALVDYAHTPDAVTRAIEALRHVHQGHITVIVGCGGDRDRGKRVWMTWAATQSTQEVILTADNPRSEEIDDIIQDMLDLSTLPPTLQDQMRQHSNTSFIQIITDRRQAIDHAWRNLPTDGALLITGKGHETYQDIKGMRYSLHDVEAVYASLYAQQQNLSFANVSLLSTLTASKSSANLKYSLTDVLVESSMRFGGLRIVVYADPHTQESSIQTLLSTQDYLHVYISHDIDTHAMSTTEYLSSKIINMLHGQHRCLLIGTATVTAYISILQFLQQRLNSYESIDLYYIKHHDIPMNTQDFPMIINNYIDFSKKLADYMTQPYLGGLVIQQQQAQIPSYVKRPYFKQ